MDNPEDFFDDEPDCEGVEIPDPDQHEARTTASEFDGALDEQIESDGEDSADERKHRKNVKVMANIFPLRHS